MNKKEKERLELRSAYQDRLKLKSDSLKEGKNSHFIIGDQKLPHKRNASVSVKTSSNNADFIEHKLDAETQQKDLKQIRKVSKTMRKANFTLSASQKFYGETTHKNFLKVPRNNSSVKTDKGRDHRCNFVLGSSDNEYISVANMDFTSPGENKHRSPLNTKDKGVKFRKHNYVVGFNKPSYETVAKQAYKKYSSNPNSSNDSMNASLMFSNFGKPNFSIGNELFDENIDK